MRRAGCVVTLILLLVRPSAAEIHKVHGFVTAVHSPASFEIDHYKITRDPAQPLDVEKLKSVPATSSVDFKPEDIRIGTELEVEGDYDASTHELKAKTVKVFLFDTVVIDRTAQLEKMPELEKNSSGAWHGLIFADGQCVVVNESTPVTFSPKLTEIPPAEEEKAEKTKKTSAANANAAKAKKAQKTDPNAPQVAPLNSLDQITADTFVHYEGTVQPDGSILATKVEFEQAGLDPGEAKLWKKMKPKVNEKDYTPSKPGTVTLTGHEYKLFPNKEVQDYVSDLGASLVPDSQKKLQFGDPLKIDFRFYVVSDSSADCIGYPDGVVLVRSGLLSAVDNEAQLAFVLSNEIAGAVEKAAWRDLEYHANAMKVLNGARTLSGIAFFPGLGFAGAYIATSEAQHKILNDDYGQSLNNQADRVALEAMLVRGYDIREAPRAWAVISPHFGDHQIVWKKSDLERRRSYLNAQLEVAYAKFDYSSLKQDSPDFRRTVQLVKNPARKSHS